MEKDSFIFYRSFQDAINEANEKEQLLLYRAIANYALNREEPQLSGIAKVAWVLIKPQLDANWRRYENGCKGAEFGKRGGAPKGNSNALKKNNPKTTPIQPQNNPEAVENTTANVNENINENTNVNLKGESAAYFTPPLLDEVRNYISEKGYSIDAERFFKFYESKNWFIHGDKMSSWQASIDTWEIRDNDPSKKKQSTSKNVNDIWG